MPLAKVTKVGGFRKIMVLWQAVFLATSPLVTAPQSNLTQRLRRQISLDYYTIPPAMQATRILQALIK